MNILVNWKESYSVNSKEIDQQHKKLIDLINVLYDAFIRKEDKDKLDYIISELNDYAIVHFSAEEKYFTENGFTHSEEHVNEHKKFLKEVEMFRNEYYYNSISLTPKIMTFLRDWLTNHIREMDQEYKSFIENKKQA